MSEKEEKPEEDAENKSNEEEAPEEAKEEEKKEPVDVEDVIEPFNAIVRVKIPKVIEEPEKDEEGKDIIVEYTEDQLDRMDDIPFNDTCLSFETAKDGKKIWVFNHLAAKALREDIVRELKPMCEKLDVVENGDFLHDVEKQAKAFEEKFIKLFDEDNLSNAPKVPVFAYRPDMP